MTSKSKPTQQRPSRQSEFNNNYHPTPTSSYNKSSSYPNFSSNSTNSNNSSNGQHYVSVNNQNANPQVIIGSSKLLELFFFKKKIVRLQSNRACSLSAKSFLRILMLSCRFFLCGKQLHNSYHRHSVSNLITITPAKTTVTITPTAPITQHQKVSSYIGLHLSSQSTPHSSLSTNSSGNSVTTPISSLAPMNYCKYYHSFFVCVGFCCLFPWFCLK